MSITKHKDDSQLFSDTLWLLLLTFLLVFAPAILYFIYSVIIDPLTPQLIAGIGDMVRRKSLGFLAKNSRGRRKKWLFASLLWHER